MNSKDIIKEVYNDVLLRDPDITGSLTYINMIDSGCLTKQKLIEVLLQSDEYITLCGLEKIMKHIKTQTNNTLTCNCSGAKIRVKKYWNIIWNILHIMTYMYPDNPTLFSQKRITRFFNNFGMMIQCEECRKHYNIYISNNSILNVTNNKNSYIKWLIDLHNNVNKRLNKPIMFYKRADIIYDLSDQMCIEIIKTYGIDKIKLFTKNLI